MMDWRQDQDSFDSNPFNGSRQLHEYNFYVEFTILHLLSKSFIIFHQLGFVFFISIRY